MYLEGLRLGVQVLLAGGKQHIAACGAQLVGVHLQGARVAVEVLVRQKLQAVDEDAGHQRVAQRPGLAHQGQVAVVQVAHGGHEGGLAVGGQGGAAKPACERGWKPRCTQSQRPSRSCRGVSNTKPAWPPWLRLASQT